MLKRFDDERTRPSRGLQIWLILIGKAHNRQTITYEQLAELLGFDGAGTLADMLGHPYFYCLQNNLPPLTVLVVKKDTGVPGDGFKIPDIHHLREEVFAFNWYGIVPPTTEQLGAAFKQGMPTGAAQTLP